MTLGDSLVHNGVSTMRRNALITSHAMRRKFKIGSKMPSGSVAVVGLSLDLVRSSSDSVAN